MEILVVLTYCRRPNIVKGFLRSLKRATRFHNHWKLAIIQDCVTDPIKPIAYSIFGGLSDRISIYETGMSEEMKEVCGGSVSGYYINKAIRDIKSDLIIVLGDDDEITDTYLLELEKYYKDNPDVLSSYCDVYLFDPQIEKSRSSERKSSDDPYWGGHSWFGKPIYCAGKVDGIQVSFRSSCVLYHGTYFTYPCKINHDLAFFEELNSRCDLTPFNGITGVYKGVHDHQLIKQIHGSQKIWENKKEHVLL